MRVLRVLLVEDNPHVSELISDGLDGAARRELEGRLGFQFEICADGRAALESLKAGAPDLIILDVYMPVMDGAQFLRHLRAASETASTPVIALSAGGIAAREVAMAAGANAFLDKPIRLSDVLKAASELLNVSLSGQD